MTDRNARGLITLFFGFAFLYICAGFLVPVLIGGAIALLLQPIFKYLTVKKRWQNEATAGLLTFGTTVLLILPVTLLSIRGVRFLATRFQAWKDSPFLDAPGGDATILQSVSRIPIISSLLTRIADLLHMEDADLLDSAGSFMKSGGTKIGEFIAVTLSSIPSFAIGVFLLIMAIYFFLADGERVVRFFRTNSFFGPSETEEIFSRFCELCRAVFLASLVTGVVQATLYLIAGAFAGVDDLLVLGFSVFIASFLPLVGAAPITFGVAIYTFSTGAKTAGIVLLIAAIIASISDNIVRPAVLKDGANLHPLIAILAIFGGLSVFGFAGVFIGPIIVGMFFVLLDAYVKSRQTT